MAPQEADYTVNREVWNVGGKTNSTRHAESSLARLGVSRVALHGGLSMTIVEIAALLVAVAFAVLVGYLVPVLMQVRKTVSESEQLLSKMNAEVPALVAGDRKSVV